MGYYWPEGMLLESEQNRYYLQNEETLFSAMRIGQILEGRAAAVRLRPQPHRRSGLLPGRHPAGGGRLGHPGADGAGYRHHFAGQ